MTTTLTTLEPPMLHTIRNRHTKRRHSAPGSRKPAKLHICQPLPLSLEALDPYTSSPVQTLASLRFLVLSYLADLERWLSDIESPDLETWKLAGESTIDEARQRAQTALEMLERIRVDVCSHLPEFPFVDMSVQGLKSHLPDVPTVPRFLEMRSHVRSHLPDIPNLPDMPDVRSHLPDMRSRFDDVRLRFNDLDFKRPLSYIPTLYNHLDNLQNHLSLMEFPSTLGAPGLTPSTIISDLLDILPSSDLVKDLMNAKPADLVEETEELLHRAASDVAKAVKRSFEGVHLIQYSDLPQHWRNNPFVTHGYRFIPLKKWPLIVFSLFAFHNETLNIHTHLIPFTLWGLQLLPYNSSSIDTPELLFMGFALLCLFCSALWHTMAGCADRKCMELCARIDYIGIGWLISASIGTVVHYGFRCNPLLGQIYLGFCFLTGLAGNIFPFMSWFNKYEYRAYRILFFVVLTFSAIAPLVSLSLVHSSREMFAFIAPVMPSLLSYIVGLIFYALHFPERLLSPSMQRRLDYIGGGSHCIWHCFIVLAVSLHRGAIASLRPGIQCPSH